MNNFIEKMAPLYQEEPSPLLMSVRLTQACLESGFCQSDLAREALNFTGIKASSPWIETYTKVSNEEIDGKLVPEKSAFRKYKSVQEFALDLLYRLNGVNKSMRKFWNQSRTLDNVLL